MIYLLIYSNKFGYLQLITILVYRSSPLKSWARLLKGATKLYFMYYSSVVIILFRTRLEKSAFSIYLFGFYLSVIYFFVFLFLCASYLCCFALCFEINFLIDLITLYSQSGNKNKSCALYVFFLFFRSSHRRWFIKKAVPKNFAIFTWKQLCWSLFLMKLQAFTSAALLEKGANTGVLMSLLRKSKEYLFWRTSAKAASVYSNDLLIYLNCDITNMLPERFWVYKEKCHLQRKIHW